MIAHNSRKTTRADLRNAWPSYIILTKCPFSLLSSVCFLHKIKEIEETIVPTISISSSLKRVCQMFYFTCILWPIQILMGISSNIFLCIMRKELTWIDNLVKTANLFSILQFGLCFRLQLRPEIPFHGPKMPLNKIFSEETHRNIGYKHFGLLKRKYQPKEAKTKVVLHDNPFKTYPIHLKYQLIARTEICTSSSYDIFVIQPSSLSLSIW